MNIWLGKEWDRGYKIGRVAGIAEERKATIDLLYKHVCQFFLKDGVCSHGSCESIREVIVLLKGM